MTTPPPENSPPAPTLGDVYKSLKELIDRGVTPEAIEWVLRSQFPANWVPDWKKYPPYGSPPVVPKSE